MDTKKAEAKKLSTSNTKQEMLDAYNVVVKQLKEKEEGELKPEKRVEQQRVEDVAKVAQSISTDTIATHIAGLKTEVGKTLSQISDKMEIEADKLTKVHQAVEIKEKEIRDLYGIEKEAQALAALIESQNRRHEEFESKMAADRDTFESKMASDREALTTKLTADREALTKEIDATRTKWAEEKKSKDAEAKEWETAEKKKREREKEEFDYDFKREQRLARDAFNDEKARTEMEMQLKKAHLEDVLESREKAVAEREERMTDLENQVAGLSNELEGAVKKAIKETEARISMDAKYREELLKKEFEGERKVLTTKIEALEKTVSEQHEQIARLSQQLDKSYQKVEDIAVKAVQSASAAQSASGMQQLLNEQTRRQAQEK
jgi:hypothetical protein